MSSDFFVNPSKLKKNATEFDKMETAMSKCLQELERIKGNLSNYAYGDVKAALDTLIEEQRKNTNNLKEMGNALENIVEAYEKAEKRILNQNLSTGKIDETIQKKLEEILDEVIAAIINMFKGSDNSCCTYGADPINFATGNFVFQKQYLKMKGLFPMMFELSYNSVAQQDGVVGKGWVHNYQMKLQKEGDRFIIQRADGGEETFFYDQGRYKHLIGGNCVLRNTDDGMEYETTYGIVYVFDREGKNTKVKDRNSNELELFYDDAGRLKEVKSTSGETLYYKYNEKSLIEEVADSEKRFVTLSYEDGYLKTITDEEGNVFQYGYDSQGNVAKIVNGRNIQTIENEYDDKNRVIKQSYPDGGCVDLEYDDAARVLHVTEQNGNQVDYIHDERMRSVETVYADGKIQYAYNDQNQRTHVIDKKGNKTQYEYDHSGNLSMVKNPLGETLEMDYNTMKQVKNIKICGEQFQENQYDDRGNLILRKDAMGREIAITYNANGKPVEIKQPDESIIKLTYDTHGNIKSIKEPLGGVTSYEYDGLGQVIATVDGNGNRTEYQYNAKGYVTAITNAEGNTKHFQYNESAKVTCIQDFDGSCIYREYNEINKLSKMTNQEGSVTTLEYDSMYNVRRRIEANGARTSFIYNKLNRLERMVNPRGAEICYEYDLNGNRTKITDSDGGVVKLEYDALNRLVKIEDADGSVSHMEYNQFGQRTKMTDAAGNVRRVIYNKAGQKESVIDARGNETKYCYTQLGHISEVVDPQGRKTTYSYLPGGLLEKVTYPDGTFVRYTYDANRNVKSKKNQDGYTLFYSYDSMNRINRIDSSEGQEKSYTYDAVGNIRSMTDANGNTTYYHYSPTGNLEAVTDALGNCTQYKYDNMGGLTDIYQYGSEELAEVSRLNETNSNVPFVHYERNIMGQVEAIADALGQKEQYIYNDNGRLVEKIDKQGLSIKYDYTKGGQLSEIKYEDGNSVKLAYNELKQLTQIKDWLGITTIEMDELGRPEKITDHEGREVIYTRGKLGQQLSMQYPGGKKVEYGYDDCMRLTSLQDENGTIRYQYDERGKMTEKLLPNGISAFYTYHTTGFLASLSYQDEEGIIDSFRYQYDAVGNKTEVKQERRGQSEQNGTYRYLYDGLNRLTGVEKDNELLRQYGYDAFGNRIFMESEGNRTDYYYNEANQLMRCVKGEDVTDYSYDARGNVTQIKENGTLNQGYEYNSMNRMVRAMDATGRASVYGYNGLGQRVSQQIYQNGSARYVDGIIQMDETNHPVKSIEYVLDHARRYNNVLMHKENSQIYEYVWDGSVAMEKGTDGIHYFLPDEFGSPLRYVNEAGNMEETYSFDEFGNDLLEKQEPKQLFGYTGFYKDTVSGTYFAQAREYMASIGRFTSRDLVKGIQSAPYTMNEYSYCWNRPLNFVDRDGAFPGYTKVEEFGLGLFTTLGFTAADYVWENYVPEVEKEKVSQGVYDWLGDLRSEFEDDLIPGVDASDILATASQITLGEAFLESVSFNRTSDGVYHADQNCWQKPFGYNDFYDYVFDGFTEMDTDQFDFTSDGTTYTIWMWKGDYFNLGAGAETGIYYGKEGDFHFNSADDTNLHMGMTVYDKNTGEKIFHYHPTDPQWWITGFNPKYQDYADEDLEVHGSIDFSENEDLWEAF